MNNIIDLLTIIVLVFAATYLAYKIPDVIINGFEHGSDVYVQLSSSDFQLTQDEQQS
jgi:hypothetical protein